VAKRPRIWLPVTSWWQSHSGALALEAPRTRIRVGNAVQGYHLYVPRPTEENAIVQQVATSGAFEVIGCRTQGKTSLLQQGVSRCPQSDGVRVIYSDCGGLGDTPSLDSWVEALCNDLGAAAHRYPDLAPPPRSATGVPARRLADFLAGWKTPDGSRILFVLDEIGYAVHQIGAELPTVLRAAVNLMASSDHAPSLCFVGHRRLEEQARVTTPGVSPVGPVIEIGDFDITEATANAVAAAFTKVDQADALAAARTLLEQVGGQPFLAMTMAQRLQERPSIGAAEALRVVDELVDEQRESPHPLVRQVTRTLVESRNVDPFPALTAYEVLLDAGSGAADTLDPGGVRTLIETGLCRRRGDRVEIKSRIHQRFFDAGWVERTRREAHTERTRGRVALTAEPDRRVYVINTGGTLGMVRKGNAVVTPENFNELAGVFPELDRYMAAGEQPFAYDSINVTPMHWKQIASIILRVHAEHPDYGFVVIHGTDTMTYTASALAFAFGQSLDFPIVFTGAQTTPDVIHGDARTNLLRACLVALKPYREVMITFGSEVYRAVRARKLDERQFAGFESVGIPPLGDVSEAVEVDEQRLRTGLPKLSEKTDVSPWAGAGLTVMTEFAPRVLPVQLIPGLERSFFDSALQKSADCRGIVLQVLGAGNVTSVAEYGFHEFIHRATEADIPVLLTSRFRWRPGAAREYRPAKGAIDEGAIPGGEMTQEAAVTKFRWAIAIADRVRSNGGKRVDIVRRIMETNFVGELDGPIATLVEGESHSDPPGADARRV
jgi:L-asparaginase/Glu-tRNA(Gln) amidotransferase subunit D